MNIRKFKLKNIQGQIWDFQQYKDYFVVEPNNLGVSFNNKYSRIKDNYILDSNFITLSTISFSMVIKKEKAYDIYLEFINFIAKNKDDEFFSLYYTPNFDNQNLNADYFIKCYIKNITKTEIKGGRLEVNFSVEKVSNWKIDKETSIIVDPTLIGKSYIYEYPYEYSSSINSEITITNNSHKEVPLLLQVIGLAQNPSISIFQNNQLVSSAQVTVLIANNQILEINADPRDQFIILKDNQGNQTNQYASQDFNKETFLFLPLGTSTITFSNDIVGAKLLIKYAEEFISI